MNLHEAVALSQLSDSAKRDIKNETLAAQLLLKRLYEDPELFDREMFASESYTLMVVPLNKVASPGHKGDPNKVRRILAETASKQFPIVIDYNKKKLGTRFGFAPKAVVVHGKDRFEAAVLRGDQNILAWVGSRINKFVTQNHPIHAKAATKRTTTPPDTKNRVPRTASLETAMALEACAGDTRCAKCGSKVEAGGMGSGCNPRAGKCGRKKSLGDKQAEHNANVRQTAFEDKIRSLKSKSISDLLTKHGYSISRTKNQVVYWEHRFGPKVLVAPNGNWKINETVNNTGEPIHVKKHTGSGASSLGKLISKYNKDYKSMYAGGPGSGCQGPNCGRKKGSGSKVGPLAYKNLKKDLGHDKYYQALKDLGYKHRTEKSTSSQQDDAFPKKYSAFTKGDYEYVIDTDSNRWEGADFDGLNYSSGKGLISLYKHAYRRK